MISNSYGTDGDLVIDVLRSAVGVEATDREREGFKLRLDDWQPMIDPNATFQTHTSLKTHTYVQPHSIGIDHAYPVDAQRYYP